MALTQGWWPLSHFPWPGMKDSLFFSLSIGPGLCGRGQATRICIGYLCCKIILPSTIWVSCIFQSLLYRKWLVTVYNREGHGEDSGVSECKVLGTCQWLLEFGDYLEFFSFQHESLWGLFQEREGRGCHHPPGAGCHCRDSREVDPENLGAKVVLDQGSVADETVV